MCYKQLVKCIYETILFMFNVQKPKKTSKKISYATFVVESPKLFSVRKTAMYGMIALLSIFMINLPTMLENTSAYATESDTILETSEHSLERNHFDLYESIHSDHDSEYGNNGFSVLHEKTNLKKHFSYGHFESNSSKELTKIVLNHGRA